MKVLYLCPQFPLLSETFIMYEIYGLIQQGADVRVLTFTTPPEAQRSTLPQTLGYANNVFLRPSKGAGKYTALLKGILRLLFTGNVKAIKSLLFDKSATGEFSRSIMLYTAQSMRWAQWKPDVVHCHFGPTGRIAAMLKQYHLIDAEITTVFHGYDVTSQLRNKADDYYRLLFKQAGKLLCVNNYFADIIKRLGAPPEKVQIHRMSVDVEKFVFTPRSLPVNGQCQLLSVGRLTEKKGFIYLIRSMKLIKDKRPDFSFSLNILGNGPLMPLLKEEIERLELTQHVILRGAVQHDEVKKYMNNSQVFILPSVTAENGDMEGIPVVLMEAMAQGLPVISTRHSGIPDLIENNVNGFLVPERDEDTLCDALCQLLDNPDSWPAITKAACQKVSEEFNHDIQYQKLNTLFTQLSQ